MKKLYKHKLDFDNAYYYVKDNLDNVNLLSNELSKKINFQRGRFFTLLPKDADLENLLQFNSFILKQNPLIDYDETSPFPAINGIEKGKYQIIQTITKELSAWLAELINNKNLACIIDDVKRYSTDINHMELYHLCGLSNEKEVYYFVDKNIVSEKLIEKCLDNSNSFWHSLCVLTEAKFDDIIDRQLTIEKIEEICCKIRLVIIGAYDGEGYVLWEPTK